MNEMIMYCAVIIKDGHKTICREVIFNLMYSALLSFLVLKD